METPARRFEVAIRIGADSVEDIIAALNHLAFIYAKDGAGRKLTSGGPRYGMTCFDRETPGQTHTQYFEQVDAWLAEARKEAEATK